MADLEHLEILRRGVDGWNMWREVNLGTVANFREAQLSGGQLVDVDFRYTDLSGADLTQAILFNADLDHADLSGANLRGANLCSASLRHSNLAGADMRDTVLESAYLQSANMCGANLSGANFAGAVMGGTAIGDVDLSLSRGLERTHHFGPSMIDRQTLAKSGPLPVGFLRGCGLAEWEIEAANLFRQDISPAKIVDVLYSVNELRSNPLIQFYSCFISYSHDDHPFALQLYEALQNQGVRCWLDMHNLLPGDKIYTEVERGIKLWDKVLLCCSREALNSWWVDHEVEIAFEKEQQLRRERGREVLSLIPLDLDGYLFSREYEGYGKGAQIRSRVVADFTNWDSDSQIFRQQLEKLLMALRVNDGWGKATPTPRL
jgi:hypothetical protein